MNCIAWRQDKLQLHPNIDTLFVLSFKQEHKPLTDNTNSFHNKIIMANDIFFSLNNELKKCVFGIGPLREHSIHRS